MGEHQEQQYISSDEKRERERNEVDPPREMLN
jgi:hypothetical protein